MEEEIVTTETIEVAYKLNLKSCKYHARKNCKNNPNCLQELGEKHWLVDDVITNEDEDFVCSVKQPGMPVGLRNLGATCYVNSLLQVWFHNVSLRKMIYMYKPSLEPKSEEVGEDAENSDYYPSSCIGQLQLIFALLQHSNRAYIDPSGFVRCLQLNTMEQQDAQEFSNLFMSFLQRKLQSQKNPDLTDVINELYQGKCMYVTRCSKCKNESKCSSTFHDLVLCMASCKTINDCINKYLKEEKLDGDDQYYCNKCESKQDATRCIKLQTLPPILNLHLMRFIYDRQKDQKKKINTCINFPLELDMSSFVKCKEALVYRLTAVLVHRGPSALSGHFIAIIKSADGTWFMFNDESIEKINGKQLQHAVEEGSTEPNKKSKKSEKKIKDNMLWSKNAYMLVYTKISEKNEEKVDFDLPEELQEAVAKDASMFDDFMSEIYSLKNKGNGNTERKNVVKEVFEKIAVDSSVNADDYDLISTSWLTRWLKGDEPVPKIDNDVKLCCHGKLHLDSMQFLKRVSKPAADILYEKYGGEKRLNKSSLCRECVVHQSILARFKSKLQSDNKLFVKKSNKKQSSEEPVFWVSKNSFRHWRRLALADEIRRLGADCEIVDEEDDDKTIRVFNEDMVCEHDQLSVEESNRKLVHLDVWNTLKSYFPSVREFHRDVTPCAKCKILLFKSEQVQDGYKMLGTQQKSLLQNLYLDRLRPTMPKAFPQVYFIVNTKFVESWRKFVKDPIRNDPVTDLCNSQLICIHGGLCYQPAIPPIQKSMTFVWEAEWEVIKSHFIVDHTIKLTVMDELLQFNCEPAVCHDCYASQRQMEEKELLNYNRAKVYIRLQCPTNMESESSDSDPSENMPASKKIKLSKKSPSYSTDSANGTGDGLNYETPSSILLRRSTRRRKTRDETVVTIASTMTVQDLKIQLMPKFSAAPIDQHLSFKGNDLADPHATLSEVGVFPCSTIYLKIDKPIEDSIDDQNNSAPEEGFKGTQLCR